MNNSLYENFINYKFSWLFAGLGSLELKSLIPIFGQLVLLFGFHFITFIFEFAKQKYFKTRAKDDYDNKMDKHLDSLKDPTKFR